MSAPATGPSAADVIAGRLFDAGVRQAFGIPGGEVLTLVDALERAGIRFRLAKHENAAGFMAEGAWHATGAPAVLVATVGPGLANAFNVAANAEQDRVPLILLSGMIDPAEALTFTHQVFDHAAVFRTVCKASFRAEQGAVDAMMDKAIGLAMAPRKGPVHIDLPVALAGAAQPAPRDRRRPPALPAAPAGPALETARARFAASRRPVIMAGLDILEEPDGPARLRAVAERHAIPVVTTYKAKGILPEDHPLALGGHGLSPKSDAAVLPVFAEADLVIAAGYDPIEMRIGWRDPWDPAKAIEFAHAPNTHDMHHAALSWVCGVAEGLEALTADAAPKPGWDHARHREALAAAFAPGDAWGADRAIAELLAALPPEAVTTADSGAHRILLSQQPYARRPRALLQSTGLCTMGCALPLALGHRLADPARPAVAFMGDAGLEMVLGELATLRDSGAPVVVVVLADRSLALIELKQRRMGLQNAGVDFAATDFAGLAELFGGRGVRVSAPGEAGPAMAAALEAERFTLIEVALPRRAYDGLF
ncbi:5-guanidino-2-oxopentanoate decarboxylase [Paralimibaculum aggregatum]|uniref:5-guanidino-2-oxopentanoate decarboxylase n=1 Tax=Paralimibaculum aggregatum TaxID=3036245 RepID=A0ABQ6LLT3_9RHOB|nr:thiamine pyrophosphate-binding protein [Limibaculum sp. NKW23]GMG82198.1 5-guanidino-2-oxopentanoate decarboxylase [Limibaculum sp. NKW23]